MFWCRNNQAFHELPTTVNLSGAMFLLLPENIYMYVSIP